MKVSKKIDDLEIEIKSETNEDVKKKQLSDKEMLLLKKESSMEGFFFF